MENTLAKLAKDLDKALQARATVWPARNHPAYHRLTEKLDQFAQAVSKRVEEQKTPSLNHPLPSFLRSFQNQPIFIVGYYKSGTTLLRNLLDGHPQLVVLPSEGLYFSLFLSQFGHLSKTKQVKELGKIWVKRLICPVGQPPFWLLGRPDSNNETRYVRFVHYLHTWADRIKDYREGNLLLALILAYYMVDNGLTKRTGKLHYWVEKTPTNEWRIDQILSCFPQARFIHVVRNPNAVIAARRLIEKQKGITNYNLFLDTYKLRRSLQAGWQNLQTLGPKRYHIIRYEDLIQHPKTIMGQLVDFMDVKFDDNLLVPAVHGSMAVTNSAYAQMRGQGKIHKASLNRYKQQLKSQDLAFIQGFLYEEALALGYQMDRPSRQKFLPAFIKIFAQSAWPLLTKTITTSPDKLRQWL